MLSKLVQKCAVTRILQIYKHDETINVCARTLTHAIAEHFMRSIQVVPFSHEDRMTTLSHYATVKSERKKNKLQQHHITAISLPAWNQVCAYEDGGHFHSAWFH